MSTNKNNEVADLTTPSCEQSMQEISKTLIGIQKILMVLLENYNDNETKDLPEYSWENIYERKKIHQERKQQRCAERMKKLYL